MMVVRPKKHLGQHFLKDLNIAEKIADSLTYNGYEKILEIGPGMGVLSQFLFEKSKIPVQLIEIDKESIEYLKENYPDKTDSIFEKDFLKLDFSAYKNEKIAVIGNFPYNISSQIYFKILENRNLVTESVGMIQKEVAQRLASPPGNKTYGILSVLLQSFYTIEYLFTVHEHVFQPPPKVKSAVIRLQRNDRESLGCDENMFFKIVKASFNQRRKTLRNSLKAFLADKNSDHEILGKRPEQLSVDEFIELTRLLTS